MPYGISNKQPGCSGWATVKKTANGFDTVACHPNKDAAVKHMVAISLAENLAPLGDVKKRAANGKKIVLSDIDGTLIVGGRRSEKVWDYIRHEEGSLFILTGRPESSRSETEQQLHSLGITYSRLIMNDGSTASSPTYKRDTAKKLLETYDIVVAIENNTQTLGYFRSLGIDAKSPSAIHASEEPSKVGNDSKGRSMSMESTERWATIAHAIKTRIDKRSGERTIELRTNTTTFEIREDGNGMTFEGYAAVFNSDSQPLPFTERVAPGAFSKSLKSRNDIKLLWNHDSGEVLASTRAGTAQLVEDGFGLKVKATLPDTTRGRDTAYLIKRGDVSAMSFGFTVMQDSWDGEIRTLESVRLHEISIVAWPAYTATTDTVSVRSTDTLDENLLASALAKMESGEDLDVAQGDLIKSVIDKLVKTDAVAEPELVSESNKLDEPSESSEPEADPNLLDLKLKQLNLQSKRV